MAQTKQLTLKPGTWLMMDCGSMPSDSNCQLIMLAPEDQKEDLVHASVKHAASKHGHTENEELANNISGMIETVIIE